MRKSVDVLRLVAKAFTNLKANDPIRMAAATAFFTFFALPPITIMLSHLFGELLNSNDQQVSWQLFRRLARLFGEQGARQLQDISQHLQQPKSSIVLTGLPVFILVLASTTLVTIIRNSLNQLWSVRPAANRSGWYMVLDKLLAFGLVLFAGTVFTGSIAIHRALSTLLKQVMVDGTFRHWVGHVSHHLLSLLVVTGLIAIIFKYLPDIRIRWRAVWVGALVTGLLIETGEFVLDHLLIHSSIDVLYGNSSSFILILLFVFYSALIFYYGASFTRYFAEWRHLKAQPGEHAVAYRIKEIDSRN